MVHQGDANTAPRLDLSRLIRSKTDGRQFRSRISVNCRSNNLIYAIECTRCGMHYVGQTKRRLMDRMVSDFASIESEQVKYPVGHHFAQVNHRKGLDDVQLFVLEFCRTPPTDEFRLAREAIERKWQYRLHSNYPLGMNLCQLGELVEHHNSRNCWPPFSVQPPFSPGREQAYCSSNLAFYTFLVNSPHWPTLGPARVPATTLPATFIVVERLSPLLKTASQMPGSPLGYPWPTGSKYLSENTCDDQSFWPEEAPQGGRNRFV